MKKCVLKKGIGLLLLLLCLSASTKLHSQSQEAQQLLLDVQKLAQLKNILADLKKGYQILEDGYSTIKNISEGNFNLHQTFLNSLLQVSPTVKNYKRIADIISTQLKIVKEYKTAFRQFQNSNLFNDGELDYISNVYANLFNQSVKNLDALATVITSGILRMSDDERLTSIDNIWKTVSDQLSFLRHFNSGT
ncbi:MAG: TerB family tellurite resistance protein, partial [Chitinophagaceae bacterium]|nr:TerB family tellurite resistance protein [Chitinophagaceae bacterium]